MKYILCYQDKIQPTSLIKIFDTQKQGIKFITLNDIVIEAFVQGTQINMTAQGIVINTEN